MAPTTRTCMNTPSSGLSLGVRSGRARRGSVLIGEFQKQGAAEQADGNQHPEESSDAEDFGSHGKPAVGKAPYLAGSLAMPSADQPGSQVKNAWPGGVAAQLAGPHAAGAGLEPVAPQGFDQSGQPR